MPDRVWPKPSMNASYDEGNTTDVTRRLRQALGTGSRETMAAFSASGVVLATAVALWLSFGVRGDEIGRFLAYELVFVLAPGWLVYRAVIVAPGGRLQQLVLGWALGYLLEIGAFAATSAGGLRNLFFAYPLLVGVPAALLASRRRRQSIAVQPTVDGATKASVAAIWAGAFVCVLLLMYAAMVGFTQMPLPRDVTSATYQEDTVFAISLAGEALHHWPVTLPVVAGEPLDYHLFAYLHMAAVSQATGIELSVVVMRLYQVSLLLLFALQLVWAGRRIGGSLVAGLGGATIVLFLGELDASLETDFLFTDLSFFWLLASHTFLVGLIFFVPAIVVFADLLEREKTPRAVRLQHWGLLAALLVGCLGAKSYAPLLVLGGGLALFSLWHLVRERAISWPAVAALGLCGGLYSLASIMLLGRNTGGADIDPLAAFDRMPAMTELNDHLEDVWGVLDSEGVHVALGTIGLLGVPLLGIALLLWYRRGSLRVGERWFLSLFAAGLPALYLLNHPGYSHFFIVFFGVVPGAILAGTGFTEFWRRDGRASMTLVSLGAVAFVAWAVVTWHVSDTPIWPALAVATILVAGGTLVHGNLDRRSVRRSGVAGLAGCAILLGALNTPLDWLPTLSERASAGRPLYNQELHGMTAGLYRGLRWVRDNTPSDAVLVVNNHSLYPDRSDSKYFYYSAFAERRVVLESWDYTPQTAARGVFSLPEVLSPFPRRLRLSNALFADGDRRALRALVCDYGATHVVVDKVHGAASPRLRELEAISSPMYSNWDLDVYDIRDGAPCDHASSG